MEGEAFSDPAIADYLNAHFLPIKVDREERPDLDSIYMQALQMMTGQGGWPLNIFLSPGDLVPFYGGTYFPVEPKYGRPGFLQVLTALRTFHDTQGEKLSAVKGEILSALQRAADLPTQDQLDPDLLLQGLAASARLLVPTGQGNRFPMMPHAEATLRGSQLSHVGEDEPGNDEQLCLQRGLDLVLGGIFDHVGGGFHRYTVDATWTVPHFEKMLYDNGQILAYLSDLWRLGHQEPAIERAIALTAQWLQREMTAPEGYFYAAQDADSFLKSTDVEPEEGAFYVWSYDELQNRLDNAVLAPLTEQFTVTPRGNFEGKNVLQRRQPGPLSSATETALAQLFLGRYGEGPETIDTFPPAQNNAIAKTHPWPGRIPAVTDTKMIVAWNGLMISGLAQAAAAFSHIDYLQQAETAAAFILSHQWLEGRCHRLNYGGTPAVLAQAEDYASLITALLDLQQATLAFPEHSAPHDWLAQAQRVQAEFDQWLWSPDGGYTSTAADASETLLVRERSYQDNATPAANGMAIANLVKLALLTEDLSYLDRAEQGLKAFGSVMAEMPRACPGLFIALDWFRHGTVVRTRSDLLPTLLKQYTQTAVFTVSTDLAADVVGLVCEGFFCKAPALSVEQLQAQLQASQRR